jgi:regulator of protease activity HflC (stomatin/prohibitin superfamily)
MTEPVTPDAAHNAPEAPQQQPDPQDTSALPEWARQSLTKANQEAAKYRTQVNELKPMADQFRALEESTKSEAQRLAEAAEAAKRDAENARAEAIRYKAAATHGISADHFDLLGSGTEEEISARAQKIAALLAAQVAPATPPPPAAPQRRPVEQMRPGATPGGTESEDDVLYGALFGNR